MNPDAPSDSRHRALALGAAAAVSSGVALFGGTSTGLAAPAESCAGLAQLLAIWTASLGNSTAIGPIILATDRGLLAVLSGCACFAAWRLSSSVLIGMAVAAAAAAVLASGSVPPFGLALSCLLLVGLILMLSGSRRPSSELLLATILCLTSAVSPQTTLFVAAAVLARGLTARWRPGATATALALATAAPVLVLAAMRLPGESALADAQCLLPLGPAGERPAALASAFLSLRAVGTYPVVLAVLALWATLPFRPTVRWSTAAIYGLGVVLADVADAPRLLPTIASMTLLAAASGLAQLARAVKGGVLRPLAVVSFAGVLPFSAIVRTAEAPIPPAEDPPDRNALSVQSLTPLLARLPDAAGLVREDALVDILLEAAARRGRSMPPIVAASAADVRVSARAQTLFALPRAQQWLQYRGFALENLDGAPGLARVEPRGTCRQLFATWRRVSDLESSETFAFVAASPTDLGPIRVYALFDAEPKLYSLAWPAETIPGFRWKLYRPGDAALAADLNADEIPLGNVSFATSYALRLDQQRTGDSPLALATTFHARPHAVFARSSASAGTAIAVCPAYPHDVVPIVSSP